MIKGETMIVNVSKEVKEDKIYPRASINLSKIYEILGKPDYFIVNIIEKDEKMILEWIPMKKE
jgi:hypothetical protein